MTKAEIKLLKEFLQLRRIDGTRLLDTVVEVIKEEEMPISFRECRTKPAILEKYLGYLRGSRIEAKEFFVTLTQWSDRKEGIEFWYNLHHHWLFVLTHVNSIK